MKKVLQGYPIVMSISLDGAWKPSRICSHNVTAHGWISSIFQWPFFKNKNSSFFLPLSPPTILSSFFPSYLFFISSFFIHLLFFFSFPILFFFFSSFSLSLFLLFSFHFSFSFFFLPSLIFFRFLLIL